MYDELLDFHFGEPPSPTSATSPTDEAETSGATTYHIQGASEDGDYIIDRTILRPTAGYRRFDLGKSLASLAARSTATLRTVPSFTRSSSGETSPSPSDDADEYDMPGAPPASLAASRRPSSSSSACATRSRWTAARRSASRSPWCARCSTAIALARPSPPYHRPGTGLRHPSALGSLL